MPDGSGIILGSGVAVGFPLGTTSGSLLGTAVGVPSGSLPGADVGKTEGLTVHAGVTVGTDPGMITGLYGI